MPIPQIVLKSGVDRPLRRGHPWIFSGAVKELKGGPQPGNIVRVIDNKGRALALGYYNPKSQIAVRILSRNLAQAIDAEFFRERLEAALARRAPFYDPDETDSLRLIHAEADGLPGFVVERYDGFIVVQCHTLGAERLKELLLDALEERFSPRGIFERSDLGVRSYEGLPTDTVGALRGETPPATIWMRENGMKLAVDIAGGQKTGFYLDQRDNRTLVRRISAGRDVLNLFSYTCATSVAAALGGARRVESVDCDQSALDLARANVEINGLSMANQELIKGDAMRVMSEHLDRGHRHDLVILDPPAFAKHRGALRSALRGYRDLNAKALRLLRRGGLLLTSSCSGLVTMEDFQQMLGLAAGDAGVGIVLQQASYQPFDHPISPAFPEGRYLKSCLVSITMV
jgi:23S rRNA (cytosine1962-C5)-methyltransferase